MLRRILKNLFDSSSPTHRVGDESTLSPSLMVTTTAAGRSAKRLKAFDFDDARVETDTKKIISKFMKPKSDRIPNPISNYEFLRCFADENAINTTQINTKQKNDKIVDVDASGRSIEVIPGTNVVVQCSPSTSTNQRVTLDLDSDDDIEPISSTLASDLVKDTDLPEGQAHGNDLGECVIGSPVIVFPDFIRYGDVYSTESQLTFASCFIKVEGSFSFGNKGPFSFTWATDDVISIESQWCEMVQTALVSIHFKLKVDDKATDSSDVPELKFSVYDPNWSGRQEAIKSLNVRYNTRWNLDLDDVTDRRPGVSSDNSFFTKHYSSPSCESSAEFIYPRGDPDAVSVTKRDIDLLKPETFINDTIIDFYAKYLENKIQPEERHRFCFLNSFFFRKLADLDKDISEVSQGRDAFRRVSRWTRKVNIFEKEYIFVPVNFSLHWSLIVICHPGELPNIEDEELEKLSKVPCILHMDSLKGTHKGLDNLIQSYLCEEWKDRQNQPTDIASLKFLKLPFISLEVPQQENLFDCGLFLLHYMECFLTQAASHFNPFKIAPTSNFLSKDWFLPVEASNKRARIKKIIREIVEDQIQKVPLAPRSDSEYPSALPDTGLDIDLELLHATCNSTRSNHTKYSSSLAGPEIEITTAAASPSNDAREAALVLCDLSDPQVARVSPFEKRYQSCEKKVSVHGLTCAMSPIEEVEESREYADLSPSSADDQQATEGSVTPVMHSYTPKESKSFVTSPIPILMLDKDSQDGDVRDQCGSPSSSGDCIEACVVTDSDDEASVNVNQAKKKSRHAGSGKATVPFGSSIVSIKDDSPRCRRPRLGSSIVSIKDGAPSCPRSRLEEQLPAAKRPRVIRIED